MLWKEGKREKKKHFKAFFDVIKLSVRINNDPTVYRMYVGWFGLLSMSCLQ